MSLHLSMPVIAQRRGAQNPINQALTESRCPVAGESTFCNFMMDNTLAATGLSMEWGLILVEMVTDDGSEWR